MGVLIDWLMLLRYIYPFLVQRCPPKVKLKKMYFGPIKEEGRERRSKAADQKLKLKALLA